MTALVFIALTLFLSSSLKFPSLHVWLWLLLNGFLVNGISYITFGSIILYQILRERNPQPEELVSADAAVGKNPGEEETELQPGAD